MKYMGWSWPDFLATPTSIVWEIIMLLNEMEEARQEAELMRS